MTTIAEQTVTIRPLSIEDIALCVPLGHAFFTEMRLPGTFHGPHFQESWRRFYLLRSGLILGLFHEERLVGVAGFLIYDDPNTAMKTAQESFWFVDPAHRGGLASVRLFRQAEAVLQRVGVQCILMVHLVGARQDKLSAFYQRSGYRPLEVSYYKEVPAWR